MHLVHDHPKNQRHTIPVPIAAYGFLFFLSVAITEPVNAAQPRPGSSERVNPAPSSSLSKAEAEGIARLWALTAPGRAYCEVAPTSSMVPVIDSKSILLLETVQAGDLHRNDIASYESAIYGSITHRVVKVEAHSIIFEGDNCVCADGPISAKKIRYRVAGILYTRGS